MLCRRRRMCSFCPDFSYQINWFYFDYEIGQKSCKMMIWPEHMAHYVWKTDVLQQKETIICLLNLTRRSVLTIQFKKVHSSTVHNSHALHKIIITFLIQSLLLMNNLKWHKNKKCSSVLLSFNLNNNNYCTQYTFALVVGQMFNNYLFYKYLWKNWMILIIYTLKMSLSNYFITVQYHLVHWFCIIALLRNLTLSSIVIYLIFLDYSHLKFRQESRAFYYLEHYAVNYVNYAVNWNCLLFIFIS